MIVQVFVGLLDSVNSDYVWDVSVEMVYIGFMVNWIYFLVCLLKLLVVEDNDINCFFSEVMLCKLGYVLVMVVDGEKVVVEVGKELFDVILMDFYMLGFDGINVIKYICVDEQKIGCLLVFVFMVIVDVM